MVPFEFDFLWELQHERLTAGELAATLNIRNPRSWIRTGQGVANQLRRLVRDGFVDHDGAPYGGSRIYWTSAKGLEYLAA